MSPDDIDVFVRDVDVIQVGARNMQNFDLLKQLGKIHKPILLKRGLCATYEEWLMSAEYIMAGGNENVILCERGIRTYETYTRNTTDLDVYKRQLLILEDEFNAVSDKLVVMTDDGSYGEKGVVTVALENLINEGNQYDEVIAIGCLLYTSRCV